MNNEITKIKKYQKMRKRFLNDYEGRTVWSEKETLDLIQNDLEKMIFVDFLNNLDNETIRFIIDNNPSYFFLLDNPSLDILDVGFEKARDVIIYFIDDFKDEYVRLWLDTTDDEYYYGIDLDVILKNPTLSSLSLKRFEEYKYTMKNMKKRISKHKNYKKTASFILDMIKEEQYG